LIQFGKKNLKNHFLDFYKKQQLIQNIKVQNIKIFDSDFIHIQFLEIEFEKIILNQIEKQLSDELLTKSQQL